MTFTWQNLTLGVSRLYKPLLHHSPYYSPYCSLMVKLCISTMHCHLLLNCHLCQVQHSGYALKASLFDRHSALTYTKLVNVSHNCEEPLQLAMICTELSFICLMRNDDETIPPIFIARYPKPREILRQKG